MIKKYKLIFSIFFSIMLLFTTVNVATNTIFADSETENTDQNIVDDEVYDNTASQENDNVEDKLNDINLENKFVAKEEVQDNNDNQIPISPQVESTTDITSFTQLQEKIDEANINGSTVTLKIMNSFEVESTINISSNITITATDNVNVTLSRSSTFTSKEMFYIAPTGVLSLQERVILNGTNIFVGSTYATALNVEGKLFINGASITNFNGSRSPIAVRGGNVTLLTGDISFNEIPIGPTSVYGGGAIHIYESGLFTMQGGSIHNNSADVWGAGVHVANGGYFVLENGEIHHNKQKNDQSSGGGIYVDEGGDFTMNGGLIHDNEAASGAGITIGHPNDTGVDVSKIEINAGEIYNNTAFDTYGNGGGIFIASAHIELNISNLYVADNIARQGGGLYNCPTADTKVYITNGSIFTNNIATVGGDFLYKSVPNSNYENRNFYISDRVLGGGLQTLYNDYKPRYDDTATPLDASEYQYINSQLLLKNIINDSNTINLAKDEAKVLVYNNTAKLSGGGIANNGYLTIGSKDSEKTLTINKKWLLEDDLIPESIKLKLIRIDSENNEVELEIFELTEQGNWTKTISDLPGNYSYRVEEIIDGDYLVNYDTTELGRETTITVTNSKKETPPVEPEAPIKPTEPSNPTDPVKPMPDPVNPQPEPSVPTQPINPDKEEQVNLTGYPSSGLPLSDQSNVAMYSLLMVLSLLMLYFFFGKKKKNNKY